MTEIIPAILARTSEEFHSKMKLVKGLSLWIQVDIMDGIFVPAKSISIDEVSRYENEFYIEAHLMVDHPETSLEMCQVSGVKRVVFHFESTENPLAVIEAVRAHGMEVGIALNPETAVSKIENFINAVDCVLLLGVKPGMQGQLFLQQTLQKIKDIRLVNPNIVIEVDGGVNGATIQDIVDAGADRLIVGSALIDAPDIHSAYALMNDLMNNRIK